MPMLSDYLSQPEDHETFELPHLPSRRNVGLSIDAHTKSMKSFLDQFDSKINNGNSEIKISSETSGDDRNVSPIVKSPVRLGDIIAQTDRLFGSAGGAWTTSKTAHNREIKSVDDDSYQKMANATSPTLSLRQKDVVDDVMEEFWAMFKGRGATGTVQGTTNSSSAAEGKGKQTLQASGNSTSSSISSRKRQNEDRDESFEDRDGAPRRPRKCPPPPDPAKDASKFACPFRKHDPEKYSIHSHRVCSLTPWGSLARLK